MQDQRNPLDPGDLAGLNCCQKTFSQHQHLIQLTEQVLKIPNPRSHGLRRNP